MTTTRRNFLKNTAGVSILGMLPAPTIAMPSPPNLDSLKAAFSRSKLSADEAAKDESLWAEVVRAFPREPEGYVNLWSIALGLSPQVVSQTVAETYIHLDEHYPGSKDIAAQKETIRKRLAAYVGCAPEHLALTRNTTDGVTTVLFGFPLQTGDEVLTTSHEHEGFYGPLDLLERRHRVLVRKVHLPAPAKSPDELAEAIEKAVSPRTRLMMVCHLYLTGQIFPVRRICDFAHARGIRVLVDGALSFGQIKIDITQLNCDFYASSLHKCGCGPKGTGFLFVKPELVTALPPLYGYFENDTLLPENDGAAMRKYERTGTQAQAMALSIASMLDLLEPIGAERIQARLHFLKQYWAKQVESHDPITFMASLDPKLSCSLLAFEVRDKKWVERRNALRKHRLVVSGAYLDGEYGKRETWREPVLCNPGIFTTPPELDRLVAAVKDLLAS